MKLPRALSGAEVARRFAGHYRYRVTRSRGSHMTMTLTAGGDEHQVTVPRHRELRVGTLDAIIADLAAVLDLPKQDVRDTLFG